MTSKNPWDGVLRQRLSRRRLAEGTIDPISAYTRYSLPPERRPTVEAAGANAHTDSYRPFLTSVVDRVGRASGGPHCAATGSVGWRSAAMKRRTG
jgi:hypothetical protein